uniref:Delta(3,5)-Delta(2,4)-dienoyl-CoA isomerase, mitochondrial n=1 Tax=Larimichthys crocea TaxID=215358 RepID=A0A0F8ACZ2_LARCR
MFADEAKSSGLVSRVFADKEAMMAGALEMAGEIAARSPVAVQGTKINLIYSRDHSVTEGLDYMSQHRADLQHCLVHPLPGYLEHEHASDSRCDEVRSGRHGEEES